MSKCFDLGFQNRSVIVVKIERLTGQTVNVGEAGSSTAIRRVKSAMLLYVYVLVLASSGGNPV